MFLPVGKGTTAGQSCSGKVQDRKKNWFLKDQKGWKAFDLHSYDVDPVWQANVSLLGCLGLDPRGGLYFFLDETLHST